MKINFSINKDNYCVQNCVRIFFFYIRKYKFLLLKRQRQYHASSQKKSISQYNYQVIEI